MIDEEIVALQTSHEFHRGPFACNNYTRASLITPPSSSTTPASTVTTTTSSSSSSTTTTTTIINTSGSSTGSSWLESTSPSSAGGGPYTSPSATALPAFEALPRFEALVQDSPNSSRGKTLPLVGSGALKVTPSQPALEGSKRGPAGSSTSNRDGSSTTTTTTSGYDSPSSRRTPPLSKVVAATGTTIAPVGLAAAGSSSFSKISSANLILAESGGAESAKIGPGQKVPVGFSGSSSTGKTAVAGKSAGSRPLAASEQEPSGNRLEGGEQTTTPEGNFSKMYFETDNHTTIASQVGSIAVLPCAVRNIGEGVVSWIRRKDYHLLTIGFTTYSSDERFNIIHSEDTEHCSLFTIQTSCTIVSINHPSVSIASALG
uniref:Ig-like domain-containing protein n=1 Tax=Anopheles quadriannulatus TaxID=34691 RepID=A0A182XKX0_ANOQN